VFRRGSRGVVANVEFVRVSFARPEDEVVEVEDELPVV